MVQFVEGHGKVVLQGHWPTGDRTRLTVDGRNLLEVGQGRVNIGARGFELKGFRMGAQFIFFGEALVGECVYGADGAAFVFAVTDIDAVRRSVVAEIVHIAVKVDFLGQFETGAVENSQRTLAAGYEKLLRVRGVDDSLWIGNAGYGTGAHARADVDDLDGVIAERGHEQLVFAVEAEMIKSSLNAGSGDGFGENQRVGGFG